MLNRWLSDPRSRTILTAGVPAAGAIVLLLIVLVASDLAAAPAGVSPRGDATVGGGATPTPPAGEWAALELAAYEPVADLVPSVSEGVHIGAESTFALRSLTSVPAVELAQGLTADPPVDLIVEAGPSAELATVRPANALAGNARYRFALRAPDGSLVGAWTFRTDGPLHVVRTLPEDGATQVPLDTGIEVEFDQDGAMEVPAHFSIEPEMSGRLESHGRTWVFVPASALAPATLYTVRVSAGVPMVASDQVLESDLQFQFETAAAASPPDAPIVVLRKPMLEVLPGEAPVIPAEVYGDPGDGIAVTRHVTVYELASLEAAVDATGRVVDDLSWARASTTGMVATEGLREVAAIDLEVTRSDSGAYLQLPSGLATGWYLVDIAEPGRHPQLVLQVTELGAYALASQTRTVAWVNDLAHDAPVAGASVAIVGGSALGQTDAQGLLDVATPDALGPRAISRSDRGNGMPIGEPSIRLLTVTAADGRQLIAPLGSESGWWAEEDRWWRLIGTDRRQYRSDDVINVWGLIRARDDRSVPSGLELRLTTSRASDAPAIVRLPVTATERGTVVGQLKVQDLPPGEYTVGLFVGDESVSQAYVSVTDIRKPTFRIDVSTERHAYVHGETIAGQAVATFYDGTAAPGMSLNLSTSASGESTENVLEADASGAATFSFTASAPTGGIESGSVSASPARPEEGSSYGYSSFTVFPSLAWLTAEASLGEGSVTVSGQLSQVDLARAEEQTAATGWVEDPSGSPIPGRRVTVDVDRVTWNPVQVGSSYDFILKRVVPEFRYDRVVEDIGTFTPTSGADGQFAVTLPFDGATGAVEVVVSAADDQGRQVRTMLYAQGPPSEQPGGLFPYLGERSGCGPSARLAVPGESVTLTIREGQDTQVPDGRTLFLVGQLGIEDLVLTTEPTLDRVFSERDMPSLTVRAVRVSPAGYLVTNDIWIRLQPEEKQIQVGLAPDGARYAPGDRATVAIRTTGPDGAPIAADVVVRAIDAKLFAIGAAEEIDVRPLMSPIASGFLSSYASHQILPPRNWGGCGATTGGDDARADFEDFATFQLVTTDADGDGSATFDLPDDLTSWAVAATAFGAGLETGTSSIELPVGLPFFVDATIASEYLAGERPVIALRAFGEDLAADEPVQFTLAAPSLGMDERRVDGVAFEPVRVDLPALPLGDHDLTISVARAGEADQRDTVVRTIHVVPSRLRSLQTAYDTVEATLVPPGGDGMTTYVVTDAGRGSLLRVLQQLAWGASARLDATLAADVARSRLIEVFDVSEGSLPPSGFGGIQGQPPEGLALLPYAAADLFLTSRAAIVAPDRMPADQLLPALWAAHDEPAATRERRIVALAGLAALGDDVLAELRSHDVTQLTVREQLWLGLGLLAAGDEGAARSIERAVLSTYGRRLGPWVRLELGADGPEAYEATATLLLLAADLRDPIAADLSRYLLDNPSPEYLPALEQLGFARSALEWLPRQTARFAWTVEGERHEETLEAGRAVNLSLTADQRRSLTLERLEGDVIVASAWSRAAAYDALPADPSVRIERTVSPGSDAPSDKLVRVTLTVEIAPGAPRGSCYEVTDLLPSGLAPVVAPMYGYGIAWDASVIAPYAVEGQRVSWCLGGDEPSYTLGYAARVVSAGTYRWEPAVVQSVASPAIGAATSVSDYTIR